jgi:lysophospholipase L1-like esterase
MRALLRDPGVTCTLILLALLGAEAVERFGWGPEVVVNATETIMTTVQNRDLNREAREALTGGYYEGLLNEGSRVSAMNAVLMNSAELDWTGTSRPGRRERQDFLYYDYLPFLDQPDYEDVSLRLVTNSQGLVDREYPIEKPARSRRIAVLGDSITRGQGTRFGTTYEALLEERLNERHLTAHLDQIEVINFAVSGYRITQTLEVALEKVPPYTPDVYLVALSDLSVFRKWGHHLGQLIYDGIDLKYPYLQNLARDARLSARDPFGTLDAKLSKFRLPTIRWILSEIRDHAARNEAEMLVVLVPTVERPRVLEEEFIGIREILSELGISYVDLLDSFGGIDDITYYSVSGRNRHPNERGHQRLFERLYERLREDRSLLERLIGPAPDTL